MEKKRCKCWLLVRITSSVRTEITSSNYLKIKDCLIQGLNPGSCRFPLITLHFHLFFLIHLKYHQGTGSLQLYLWGQLHPQSIHQPGYQMVANLWTEAIRDHDCYCKSKSCLFTELPDSNCYSMNTSTVWLRLKSAIKRQVEKYADLDIDADTNRDTDIDVDMDIYR